MNRQEAMAVWALMSAAAPGAGLTTEQLEIRAELILDLDAGPALAAAQRLARTERWMPSVAQFREATVRPSIPPAGDAWAEVLAVVRRLGWPSPPTAADFSDPLIFRAVQSLGSWPDFCAGEEAINRAHFLKVYPALAEKARVEAIAGPSPVAAIAAAQAAETGGVTLDLRLDRELGEAL